MVTFVIRNNRDSFLPITIVTTASGRVETSTIGAKETRAYTGVSLSTETQKLVDIRALSLVESSVAPAQNTLPQGLPLVWGGDWVRDVYYQPGWFVNYSGINYIVIKAHKAVTIPPNDLTRYLVGSIANAETFFGIEVSGWTTNQTVVKTDDGFEATLIGDAHVSSLSISKISGLQAQLNDKLDVSDGVASLQVTDPPTQGNHAVNLEYLEGTYLPLAGGVMEGPVSVPDPSAQDHAVNLSYAQQTFLAKTGGALSGALTGSHGLLPLAGGTMSGMITLPNTSPTANLHVVPKNYVDTADALRVLKAGDTMSGPLVLSGAPTEALHAASKTYVDAADALLLPKAGGTVTGALEVSGALTSSGKTVATRTHVQSSLEDVTVDVVFHETATFNKSATFASSAIFDDGIQVGAGASTFDGDVTVGGTTSLDVATFGDHADFLGHRIRNLGTPSASGDAVNKDYVDATTFTISAGSSNRLEGVLALQSTTAGDVEVALGLYEDADTEGVSFKGANLVSRKFAVEVLTDYLVEPEVGTVLVTSTGLVNVWLDDAATNMSEITVKKVGGTGSVMLSHYSKLQPGVLTVLDEVGESVVVSPIRSDTGLVTWHVTSRIMPDPKKLAAKITTGAVITHQGYSETAENSSLMGLKMSSTDIAYYKVGDVVKLETCSNSAFEGRYIEVLNISSTTAVLNEPWLGAPSVFSCSAAVRYSEVEVSVFRSAVERVQMSSVADSSGNTQFTCDSTYGEISLTGGNTLNISRGVDGMVVAGESAALATSEANDLVRAYGNDGYQPGTTNFGRVVSKTLDDTDGTSTVITTIPYRNGTSSLLDTYLEVTRRTVPSNTDVESIIVNLSDSITDAQTAKTLRFDSVTESSSGWATLNVEAAGSFTAAGDLVRVLGGDYSGVAEVVSVDTTAIEIRVPYVADDADYVTNIVANITPMLGRIVYKSGSNTTALVRTGAYSASRNIALRVSGWDNLIMHPVSAGWMQGQVVPLTDVTGTADLFAGTFASYAASSNRPVLTFSTACNYYAHGIKAGDTVRILSINSGVIPTGTYTIYAVSEGSRTITLVWSGAFAASGTVTTGSLSWVQRNTEVDASNLLDNYHNITGVAATNTDDFKLYFDVVDDGGSNYHVDVYSDAAMSALVAHTASYASSGSKALVADNSSGLGGTIDVVPGAGTASYQWRDVVLLALQGDEAWFEDNDGNGLGTIIDSATEVDYGEGTTLATYTEDVVPAKGITILANVTGVTLPTNLNSVRPVSSPEIAMA